jgi:hypothetical protein
MLTPQGLSIVAGTFKFITDEDMYAITTMRNEWEESLDDFNPIEVFPEHKKLYHAQLKREIEQCEADLLAADEVERQARYILDTKCPDAHREFWDGVVNTLFVAPLREGREKTIKQNRFRLNGSKQSKNGATECDISDAKKVPVSSFIKINRSGFATCPFHTDKTPSLKYYKKDNRWHCFSCNTGGDVIDLVMKMNGTDFVSTVKTLLK